MVQFQKTAGGKYGRPTRRAALLSIAFVMTVCLARREPDSVNGPANVPVPGGLLASPCDAILVKLRERSGVHADEIFKSGRRFADCGGDASLDGLFAQCGVRECRPVFSHLAEEMKRTGGTEAQIIGRIAAGVASRSSAVTPKPPARNLRSIYRLRIDGIDTTEAVSLFRRSPAVEYAEQNVMLRPCLEPTAPAQDPDWWKEKIELSSAHTLSTGSGIIVAVIDTGIERTHVDLASNIWYNPGENGPGFGGGDKSSNGLDDDGNGFIDDWWGWNFSAGRFDPTVPNEPMDGMGHGTMVAGLVAAVAPGAKIMAVRTSPGTVYEVSQSTWYAFRNGAQIINLSLGTDWPAVGDGGATLRDTLLTAADWGRTVVAAAGNESMLLSEWRLASFPTVVCVGASNRDDLPAERADGTRFSNWGWRMDVAAPGQDITSSFLGNSRLTARGTSLSAPIVSGICALLWQYYPDTGPNQMRSILKYTADDIHDPGYDTSTGAGRVNAYRALSNAGSHLSDGGPYAQIRMATIAEIESGRDIGEVFGTAKTDTGFDFARWDLEYWSWDDPQWTYIAGSTTPVVDGSLGVFPWTQVPRGTYRIRLAVRTVSGHVQYTELLFNQIFDVGTPRPGGSGETYVCYTGPKIADLDRDGANEIVFAPYSTKAWVIDGTGTDKNGWPVDTGALPDYSTHPAVGNLDDDPQLEVVLPRINKIHAYNHDGTPLAGFPVDLLPYFRHSRPGNPPYPACYPGRSVALADLNKDGRKDVVAVYSAHNNQAYGDISQSRIFAIDGRTLVVLWQDEWVIRWHEPAFEKSYLAGRLTESAPALGDLDGGGALEILVTAAHVDEDDIHDPTINTRIYAYRSDGTPVSWSPITGIAGTPKYIDSGGSWIYDPDSTLHSPATITDKDNNGTAEFVLARKQGFYAWDRNGNDNWGDPYVFEPWGGNTYNFSVSTGRFLFPGDAAPSQVLAYGAVRTPSCPGLAVSRHTTTLSHATFSFAEPGPSNQNRIHVGRYWRGFYATSFSEPLFADVTGDGINELVVNETRRTHALTGGPGGLQEVPGFPVENAAGSSQNPMFFSTPAIGDVTGDGRNDIVVFDQLGFLRVIPTQGVGTPDWACWGGDNENTRCARSLRRTVELVVSPSSVTLLPGQSFQFSIRAVDAFGDPMPLTLSASGGTINTAGWYFAPQSAGIYNIEARSGGFTRYAYVTVPVTGRAFCHDTSNGGPGVQAGDRVVIYFNSPVPHPEITPISVNAFFPVAGKSWGQIRSYEWNGARARQVWPGESLEIVFAGVGTTVGPSDTFPISQLVEPNFYGSAPITLGGTFDRWLRGDLNYDGVIDVLDVAAIIGVVSKGGTLWVGHILDADMNGDLTLDILDVVTIVNIAFRGAPEIPPPSPLTLLTASLPGGVLGRPYSVTAQAAGGTRPYRWSLFTDAYSWSNLSIDPATGAITGTPQYAGVYTYLLVATDAVYQTVSRTFTVPVVRPDNWVTLLTFSLPDGTLNSPYSATLQATNGTVPYTWSASGLPAGLSISASSGQITGTPTRSGKNTVFVTVRDAAGGVDSRSFALTVDTGTKSMTLVPD